MKNSKRQQEGHENGRKVAWTIHYSCRYGKWMLSAKNASSKVLKRPVNNAELKRFKWAFAEKCTSDPTHSSFHSCIKKDIKPCLDTSNPSIINLLQCIC